MAQATPAERPDKTEKTDKQSVIHLVNGTEETANERLVKKHLPAWVISGGLHVVLSLSILGYSLGFPTAKATPNRNDTPVTVDERKDEPDPIDLTNPNAGLDAKVETAIDAPREAEVNVDGKVNETDPIGKPDEAANIPADNLNTLGKPSDLLDAGNATNLPGAGMTGEGGLNGAAMNNSQLGGRSAASRDKLVAQFGGSKDSELAVARGLLWLSKMQKTDGSWVYDGGQKEEVIAATGMSLLPFLAAGQTHKAPKDPKDNKYQKTVIAGLAYLTKSQKPDGSFKGANNMYSHAIGTIALCEAFGMTSDKSYLQKHAQAAINFIMNAQGVNGSWGYQAKSNGDTSIVGWQLQALQSAKLCKDLVVKKEVFEKATKFLDSVATGSSKATYGYSSPGATPTLTAVALLCRYYVDGWGSQHPGMNAGVEFLNKEWTPTQSKSYDMYYFYYATQVMHFFEGDTWKKWNDGMRDMLIKLQINDEKKPALHGSWDPDKSPWMGAGCGRLGTTCMALLTLEVYYRHTPLYRRDNAGLKELQRGK